MNRRQFLTGSTALLTIPVLPDLGADTAWNVEPLTTIMVPISGPNFVQGAWTGYPNLPPPDC